MKQSLKRFTVSTMAIFVVLFSMIALPLNINGLLSQFTQVRLNPNDFRNYTLGDLEKTNETKLGKPEMIGDVIANETNHVMDSSESYTEEVVNEINVTVGGKFKELVNAELTAKKLKKITRTKTITVHIDPNEKLVIYKQKHLRKVRMSYSQDYQSFNAWYWKNIFTNEKKGYIEDYITDYIQITYKVFDIDEEIIL